MKVSFIPFRPEHLSVLDVPQAREYLRRLAGRTEGLAGHGLAETAVVAGAIVGCAGIVPLWAGRATAWALIGNMPRRAWPAVTGRVVEILDRAHAAGHLRIEATVDAAFPAGLRWIARLGFEMETPRLRFYAGGRDHVGFVRLAASLFAEEAA